MSLLLPNERNKSLSYMADTYFIAKKKKKGPENYGYFECRRASPKHEGDLVLAEIQNSLPS